MENKNNVHILHPIQPFIRIKPTNYQQNKFLNYQNPLLTNTEHKFQKDLYLEEYQKRRIKSTYVDINSAFRNKVPIVQYDETILLENNPLSFKNNSNSLFIKHRNNGFDIGDNISVNGVVSQKYILRTIRGIDSPTFDIPPSCNFMKIYCKHNMVTNNIVKIDGIKGDNGTFLGSIPINIINKVHNIKLTLDEQDIQNQIQYVIELRNDPDYFKQSSEYFFIILPIKMYTIDNPYILEDYNFKIVFKSLYGVPLNIINSYHVIKDVSCDGYVIELPYDYCVFDDNLMCCGGDCVHISKVDITCNGYPNPNNYSIDLQNVFHNVIAVNLISTEFPNTKKLITTNINNKLYWNNIEDGDYLHSIEINEGNYTVEELIDEINYMFSKYKYTNNSNYHTNATLNNNTGEVMFKYYKIYELNNAISDINNQNNKVQITINHPNHNIINTGTKIIIENASDYKGISKDIINGTHIINEILSADKYIITLPKDDYDGRKKTVNHYMTVKIPNLFRLRFDQPDTLGSVLGFTKCGELSSITNYCHKISNNDMYECEYYNDIKTICKKNIFHFYGNHYNNNYIIMVMEPIKTLYTLGKIKNAFAKIQLCSHPGEMLYNTFVPIYYIYDNPLKELHKLSISFYNPDGTLFDFNCIDHSFTLEIVTVVDVPEDTTISANTGKNYNYDVM